MFDTLTYEVKFTVLRHYMKGLMPHNNYVNVVKATGFQGRVSWYTFSTLNKILDFHVTHCSNI